MEASILRMAKMTESVTDPMLVFREPLRLAVSKLPRPVKLRAENSLDGFERARRLIDIDREMASFRAITAEEEAAAALFRSFQERKYPGAELLSPKDHKHKAALGPFIQAVRHQLATTGKFTMTVQLDASAPSLTISLPMSQFGIDHPDNLHLTLVQPLGIVATFPGIEPDDHFDRSLKVVAGSRQVNKLIQSEANTRNHLLYASDSGLPRSKATLATIEMRQRRAEIALMLTIAVLQTEELQGMATQCLGAFLKVLGCSKKDPSRPALGPDEKGS